MILVHMAGTPLHTTLRLVNLRMNEHQENTDDRNYIKL